MSEKLYLIDPWDVQHELPDKIDGEEEWKDVNCLFESVQRRFQNRSEVEFIRAPSDDAVAHIENESLDWVYIDGNHLYEPVKRDLEQYFPKVKPGGWITGDDYTWGKDKGYPVKRAVDEFGTATSAVELKMIKGQQFVFRKVHST